jgi:hypothetical protein
LKREIHTAINKLDRKSLNKVIESVLLNKQEIRVEDELPELVVAGLCHVTARENDRMVKYKFDDVSYF